MHHLLCNCFIILSLSSCTLNTNILKSLLHYARCASVAKVTASDTHNSCRLSCLMIQVPDKESASLHYTSTFSIVGSLVSMCFYLTHFTTLYQFVVPLTSPRKEEIKKLKIYLQQLFLGNGYIHTCFGIWQLPFDNLYAAPLTKRSLKQSLGNNQTWPTLEFLFTETR